MSSSRYPDAFKIEAVKQITERGRPVAEVSLYAWLKQHGKPVEQQHEESALQAETLIGREAPNRRQAIARQLSSTMFNREIRSHESGKTTR